MYQVRAPGLYGYRILYTVHRYTMCTIQCILYAVQRYLIQCTQYDVHCTTLDPVCVLRVNNVFVKIQRTMYGIHCAPYYSARFNIRGTMYAVLWYTIQGTRYTTRRTIHRTLYGVYCTAYHCSRYSVHRARRVHVCLGCITDA